MVRPVSGHGVTVLFTVPVSIAVALVFSVELWRLVQRLLRRGRR